MDERRAIRGSEQCAAYGLGQKPSIASRIAQTRLVTLRSPYKDDYKIALPDTFRWLPEQDVFWCSYSSQPLFYNPHRRALRLQRPAECDVLVVESDPILEEPVQIPLL
ncbi:hypothetical protein PsYK624_026400 [Phanerochaete sordida]|uniref:Uncharacterized protein n=1 Tax=Phanerochaete sordida TaxID=48140 RepID=A0A9P3L8X9_9APHY|nr:hypothetical protein PsYK624_026400 [Phanerochaete sordida]